MDLVLAEQTSTASDSGTPTGQVPGLVAVTITPEARQRMGLALEAIGMRPLVRTLRTSARIVPDETRQARVTTKVEGWVESLDVGFIGQVVKKGDPLLTIYSPDLLSAQEEFLIAVKAKTMAAAGGGDALLAAARRRLQLWDITDEQIALLEKRGEPVKAMTLYAPTSGRVTGKNVLAGQKIMPGESLLVVSDFSTVWGEADIYESDLPFVHEGMPLEISLPFWQGKIFSGTVSFVAPTLDPVSRTVKARLVIPNPELLLKPEMYAEARLSYSLGERLAIPEAAVMRTGEHSYTFREGDDGALHPVEVGLGARVEGFYEVLSGLKVGDRVVTAANFLVDSESSMRAALESVSRK
jgi:Cu(I)/Ag(I) efflux system membrane fusion protein